MKIFYIIRVMLSFDYAKFFRTVNKISKRSKKNKAFLFFDIIRCGFKYGAGYSDYYLYEFEDLSAAQRKDYLTREKNNRLIRLLNDRNEVHKLSVKSEFNELFGEFIGRRWLDLEVETPDELEKMGRNSEYLAAKPQSSSCGEGFEKIRTADIKDYVQLYHRLINEGKTLVEEYVVQHPDIAGLYPDSVNTLRIATINHNNKIAVIYAFIRIGNHGACVDNLNAGGMCAPIDVEKGIITYPGYDKDGNTYITHPQTGTKILGYRIPMWDRAKEICFEAAGRVPRIGYVGWDISLTEKGPILIEGNDYPGYDILQLPAHNPEKKGICPIIREYVPEF